MTQPISIAICTHNRSGQLQITLRAFFELLSVLTLEDELLIVDNASDDDTFEVYRSFTQSENFHGCRVRYIHEPKRGLSCARNRALSEFKCNWIIFFDDDITLFPETIKAYRQAFQDGRDFSFYGGKISVDWGDKCPFWYKPGELSLIDGMVGHYNLGGDQIEYRKSSRLPFGANFALKRDLIDAVGSFDENLGVRGNDVGRGEESDFILRALDMSFRGLYLEGARVNHRFQLDRLNLKYLVRYGIAKGKVLNLDGELKWKSTVFNQVFRGLYQLIIGRVGNFYQCVINVGIAFGSRRR
ncbi:MAG: glycosyltransferase family 2 protein [Gammaproteobacteria bacterium]|nr:glycosyltransferase family 2 protein [Gammaproteobacteria bacterium]